MNNTRAIALSAVLIYALWAAMLCSFAASIALMASSHHAIGSIFGLTTLVLLGVATVATIRCYVLRVCGLIRALNGIETEWNVPGLHTVP